MRPNRYPATCYRCLARVPANGGQLERVSGAWLVSHLACASSGQPEVVTFTFSSGETQTRNRKGRCIDAPCCGCCSI